MNREFTADLIEQKKDLVYVAGIALTDLASGDTFTMLYRDGRSASQRKPAGTVSLTIHALVIDGEPQESATSGDAVLLALEGDSSVLQQQAEALGWRRKSGRWLRTSELALTLSDAPAAE